MTLVVHGERPTALMAETRNKYAVPLRRPVKTRLVGLAATLTLRHVPPEGA